MSTLRGRLLTSVHVAALSVIGVGTSAYAQADAPQAPAGRPGAEIDNLNRGPEAARLPVGSQEIVVTAQKRAENIRDVPIAITAITGEHTQDLNLRDLQDLTAFVPSLHTATPGNAASSSLSLRGVGQRDVNMHNEGAVAVFIDGAYISFLSALGQPIYDLERIEVLKGPQGTLFGRNATGGLVHFISKKPSRDLDGYLTLQYGSYNEVRAEGALGGEIAPNLMARASVLYNRADGYFKNNSGDDLNETDNLAARLQLLFEPSESFSYLVSARTYQAFDVAGAGFGSRPYIVDATGDIRSPRNYAEYAPFCMALVGAAPPPGAEIRGNCFSTQPNALEGDASPNPLFGQAYYGLTGTGEVDVADGITLTSITDYQHIKMDYIVDLDLSVPIIANFEVFNNGSKQFSQELRIAGDTPTFDWVAGLYYLKIDHDLSVNTDVFNHPGFGVRLPTDYKQHTNSKAAFAQIDWQFAPRFTLSLGGRIMHDKKRMRNDAQCIANPALVPAAICEILDTFVFPGAIAFNRTFIGKLSHTDWSGRAVVKYEPNDLTMIYGGVSRGYKGGGFNAGGVQFYRIDEVPFKPEILVSYEVGLKTTNSARSLGFDASLFYYDYKDYQTVSFGSVGALRVLNVDATIKGAEVTVNARPFEGLNASLSGLYLDTEQKDVPLGNGTFMDFQIPDAPEWSFVGELRYDHRLARGSKVALQLNGIYVAERSISAIDHPDQRIGSYLKLDARVTWTSPDERWKLAAFVNNLTDKHILSTSVDFTTLTGGGVDAVERPRWFGGSATYRFGR